MKRDNRVVIVEGRRMDRSRRGIGRLNGDGKKLKKFKEILLIS